APGPRAPDGLVVLGVLVAAQREAAAVLEGEQRLGVDAEVDGEGPGQPVLDDLEHLVQPVPELVPDGAALVLAEPGGARRLAVAPDAAQAAVLVDVVGAPERLGAPEAGLGRIDLVEDGRAADAERRRVQPLDDALAHPRPAARDGRIVV